MKHVERRTLTVEDAIKGDVYKDIVRIHWRERGKRNRIGAIVSISVDGGPRHFFLCEAFQTRMPGKSDSITFLALSRD
jgi:hypothetical protein